MAATKNITKANQAGFTLAELAILLAVFSIIASTLMLELVSGSAVSSQETTIKRMQAIEQAVLAHWVSKGRMPCPAPGDAALDDAEYGTETGVPGDCTANGGAFQGPISPTCNNWNTNCAATCTSDCGAVGGVVPVRALNLPDEFALDGWNRRFTYIIDERFTQVRTSPVYQPALILTENHAAPASAVEIGRYPLILISHGRAGDRAFPANGSTVNDRPNTLNLNDTEMHNVSGGWFNNRYVLQPFRPDLPSASGRFDQLVRAIDVP